MKRILLILLLMLLPLSLIAERGDVYFNRGIVYILIGDAPRAIENIDQYFKINPAPALRTGYLKMINHDIEEATDRFRNYLNINPRSLPGIVGIALATADMEVSNSIEVLERAIRLNRGFSSAYLCLGMEYMKKKIFSLAETNLKRALNISSIPEYKIILAKLYLLFENPQGVIALLKKEADVSPDNFHYSFLTAQAYFNLNNLRETGKYIETALEVYSSNNEAKLLKAKYLIGINELKKARNILKGLNFNTYNKDYIKTYTHVLLELKDISVEDYLYEFFALDKWDDDINRLLGRFFLWQRGKGNVQNFINRALLSGADLNRMKKEFGGEYRFPEYKYVPFFDVKKIKWISENMILLVGTNRSGESERIFIFDTETMKVVQTLNFRGTFQEIFLPPSDSSDEINIIISTIETEGESVNLYALNKSGRNIIIRPVFSKPIQVSTILVGFNKLGNLAYITDAVISTIAFESPFSKVSDLGRKSPIYPDYPFNIYQYNFNNFSVNAITDPEQIRQVPIKEVREFFLVANAYQYNESVKGLINKGERLELTSTEVVRTFISEDLSAFIIYLADLTNAFQAVIYDSAVNRIKKVDETMFLGKGQYAEVRVLDFRPRQKELIVVTNDKEKRLINFNYNSFLYDRISRNTFDFLRDIKADIIYILTERSKKKYYMETDLDVLSLNPYHREKIRSRKDLNKIVSCDELNQVYFSTYNGELLKMDMEYKFHYAGPSLDDIVSDVLPVTNKRVGFINGRLLLLD